MSVLLLIFCLVQ